MKYAHLHPGVHDLMRASDEDRARSVLIPRWIGYPNATTILDRMQYLHDHPPMHRMPNLIVVGDSHNGKTLLAERFVKRHPADHDLQKAVVTVPVVMVVAPLTPDEGRLYNVLLDYFNAPYRLKDDPERKRRQLSQLLRDCSTRVIIIDEIHNLIAGHSAKQRLMLNAMKQLSVELRIPIVVMGTTAALRAIQTDPQYANRYDAVYLPKWRHDDAFRTFLHQYESTLPLRNPSGLANESISRRLHFLSEGLIGEVTKILAEAVHVVIRNGQERIDLKTLEHLPHYVSPTKRRERAGV